jgi:general secretion pathway protein K
MALRWHELVSRAACVVHAERDRQSGTGPRGDRGTTLSVERRCAPRQGAAWVPSMTAGSNRGIALISVLWITALLGIMAASFASTIRTEMRLADNHKENAKAEALADAGVHRAVFRLLNLDSETAWHAGHMVYSFSLGEGNVQVRIEDEDGKIDLNGAPLQLLAGLFVALGLPEEDAQVMADRIGDFRDEDSEPEPLGAEDEAYLDAGLSRGAADRPLVAESELLRVLGMTQSLYEQVRPYVTVYSGAEGIDPTRAPRPVLEALPGITPEIIEALLNAGREIDPYSLIDDEPLLDLGIYLVPSRDLVFTIRVLGRTSGGGQFVRQAVIELDASRDSSFLVYTWTRRASFETAG